MHLALSCVVLRYAMGGVGAVWVRCVPGPVWWQTVWLRPAAARGGGGVETCVFRAHKTRESVCVSVSVPGRGWKDFSPFR